MSSQAPATADVRAEIGVVARSTYANRVHRPDPSCRSPQPACHEANVDHAEDYREVSVDAVTPHYQPCQNPACFGTVERDGRRKWRKPGGRTRLSVAGISVRPLRVQSFQIAVSYLSCNVPPLTRRTIHAMLAVESTERSIQRGLSDALALGWLTRGSRVHEYEPGPLTGLFDAATPEGRQYWRDTVVDPSRRVRGLHGGIVAAVTGETPVTSGVVADRLDISGERTLQRGLRDARDAGWLVWDESASAYRQGPLAVEIADADPHPHAGGGEQ